jgi:hypothetical protein
MPFEPLFSFQFLSIFLHVVFPSPFESLFHALRIAFSSASAAASPFESPFSQPKQMYWPQQTVTSARNNFTLQWEGYAHSQ